MDALEQISAWIDAGRPMLSIAAGALVALCFVGFNAVRILLYLPQLLTCYRDEAGCRGINVFTWSSWIGANTATGLYMWIFLDDAWGLLLNLGNALMCAATVAVTVTKRRRHARALAQQQSPLARPAAAPHGTRTASARRACKHVETN
jgi:hypothetical protein